MTIACVSYAGSDMATIGTGAIIRHTARSGARRYSSRQYILNAGNVGPSGSGDHEQECAPRAEGRDVSLSVLCLYGGAHHNLN